MESKSWIELERFLEEVTVQESLSEVWQSAYHNWKSELYEAIHWTPKIKYPINWEFGKLVWVWPLTYVIGYQDKTKLTLHKSLFSKLQKLFDKIWIEQSVNFQLPRRSMGYFSFDNNELYLLIDLDKIDMWTTNDLACYNWIVINPEEFLMNISRYTNLISQETASEILEMTKKEIWNEIKSLSDLQDKTTSKLSWNLS